MVKLGKSMDLREKMVSLSYCPRYLVKGATRQIDFMIVYTSGKYQNKSVS